MIQSERRSGIALVLIAGLLTLLAAAATGFTALASGTRASVGIRTDQATARLLARSGMVYAEARLRENPAPARAQTRDTQPDDWTYRDDPAFPLEKARNPSYAQTEPYTDVLNDGAFNGSDPFVDQNANGRFDAWSGRLRGGRSAASVFLLRVEGAAGKLCINDGFLDGRSGSPGDPALWSYLDNGSPLANLDLLMAHHRLADLVNELALIAGAPASPPPGDALIRNRPVGGYASPETVRGALGPAAWSRIGRFLTTASSGRLPFGAGNLTYYATYMNPDFYPLGTFPVWKRHTPRTPLDLSSAEPLLLQALLQDAGPPGSTFGESEAGAFGAALAARRPFATWQAFFRWLHDFGTTTFTADPPRVESWINQAEMILNPDPFESTPVNPGYSVGPVPNTLDAGYDPRNPDEVIPCFSWRSYDLDRLSAPRPNGDRRLARIAKVLEGRMSPEGGWGPWGTYELDLEAEGLFQVESLGRASVSARDRGIEARGGMTLEMTRRVRARSQDDFENLDEQAVPGPGVRLAGRSSRDRMQTYPVFSMDSCPEFASKPPLWRYPDFTGSIWLMDRSAGPRGGTEAFYLPCWEKGQPARQPAAIRDARQNFEDASGNGAFPYVSPHPPFCVNRMATQVGLRGDYFPDLEFPGSCGSTTCFSWHHPPQDPVSPSDPRRDNDGSFPMPLDRSGTFEWEHLNGRSLIWLQNPMLVVVPDALFTRDASVVQLLWVQGGPRDSDNAANQPGFVPVSELLGVRLLQVPGAHAIAFTFGTGERAGANKTGGQIHGYIDGIPDPGLIWPDYQGTATNTTFYQSMRLFSVDEVRLDTQEQPPLAVLAHGVQSRYWLPDEGAPGVPTFRSARYTFEIPVEITDAHWEGYVPRLIRDAALDEAAGGLPAPGTEPLWVELLLYKNPWDAVPECAVPLVRGGWRAGGGTEEVEAWLRRTVGRVPRFRAVEYRIGMDASAVAGVGNETPHFDSISFGIRGASRMSGWSEE